MHVQSDTFLLADVSENFRNICIEIYDLDPAKFLSAPWLKDLIKELAEEFKKQFTCLGENTEKHITFTVSIENEVTGTIKMEKKLQEIDLTHYNLLIAHNSWQALYQIFSIIFLKEFIELNVNSDMMLKKQETCEIKYKYCNCFLEYINFKDNLIEYKCFFCNKIINTSLMKS